MDAEESAKYFLRIVEDQKYALDELQANVTLWKEMYKETQQVNIRGYVVSDPVEGR